MDRQAAVTPTRRQAVWFWLRTRRQIARQGWRNWFDRQQRRWSVADALVAAPIRAQAKTPLWDDGREDEFILVAGKVHNLRLAAQAFHAVEVPAGACLSFWRQLGRPSARRGFVLGREVREGCVVPTIAGGICQISNALASCARQAGFELVERHAHSAKIEGQAERGEWLDATVFWNYVDLKIRAPVAWRLELELTATELVLTIRTQLSPAAVPLRKIPLSLLPTAAAPDEPSARPTVRGCLSCEQTACFRHRPALRKQQGRTALLLDARTPEFTAYLSAEQQAADRFLPLPPRQWLHWLLRRKIGGWAALPATSGASIVHAVTASLRRAYWLRRWARHAGRRQSSVLDGQRWLAAAYAQHLRPQHTHLLIDQGLLPWLQQAGVLGGRSYDVLATALPMGELQQRLDRACRPDAAGVATLTDFRAEPTLLAAEVVAMRGARRVITAHAEVAEYWRANGAAEICQLSWVLPAVPLRPPTHSDELPLVVFPASALARKGAYELAEALRGLPCRLRVLGTPSDDARLWQGIEVEHVGYASDWLAQAAVVVLPAHVEHAPRAALAAVAAAIPVIATPACGLQGLPGVLSVAAGDAAALRVALQTLLTQPSTSVVASERPSPSTAATAAGHDAGPENSLLAGCP